MLSRRLPAVGERSLVVLTGPRQAGKTTLARRHYADLPYVSLDAPEEREFVRDLRTGAWQPQVGEAVIDEAQKEPVVFDKVKHAYDQRQISFSVLLGSAQILLMKKVKETLAGRALIFELWPLSVPELAAYQDPSASVTLLQALLSNDEAVDTLLSNEPTRLPPRTEESTHAAIDHIATWGGMPNLLTLSAERRRDWLRSYTQTYLERDLADLARLSDLNPFYAFQRLCALRAGNLLAYSDLARDAKISPNTAQKYMEYLRISYQAFLLKPYFENLTSTVIKAPKVYWSDMGILRQLLHHEAPLTGPLFENLVIAETMKLLHTLGLSTEPYYYRTRSGLEVDLLLVRHDRFLGIEIKNRDVAHRKDAQPLKRLARALDRRWRGGLIVYRGKEIRCIDRSNQIWAVPLHRLLGAVASH